MTERPILFSAAMIRALLDGRKQQTRRILTRNNVSVLGHSWRGKSCPWEGLRLDEGKVNNRLPMSGAYGPHLEVPFCHPQDPQDDSAECAIYRLYPNIEIGDRLYVREHWRTESHAYDDLAPSQMDADYPVIYEADADWSTNKTVGRFRPGIHMPRWASRLTLTVTDVRVQRLQEISEADCLAEGIPPITDESYWAPPTPANPNLLAIYRGAYMKLWDEINGRGAAEANPWVTVIHFSTMKQNIDEVA